MSARINDFRAAVVTAIHAAMPALRECAEQFGRFNLDELETTQIKTPAVRVAVLSAKPKAMPGGQVEAQLSCAAFVVVDGKERDRQAWAMAEAIAVLLLPVQMFGLVQVGAPSALQIQPVLSASIRSRGVAVIAVEWTQELRQLGAAIWDDEKHLLTKLYVNDELAIGDPGDAPE